jgi:hypothetical protein
LRSAYWGFALSVPRSAFRVTGAALALSSHAANGKSVAAEVKSVTTKHPGEFAFLCVVHTTLISVFCACVKRLA